MYKNPIPIEKIYEAWTAVADGRVTINADTDGEGNAVVVSSSGDKTYMVKWKDGARVFSSTDNATVWRGYPGYPIIAVLMKLGLLPYSAEIAEQYKGINWSAINKVCKGNYAKALAETESARGIDKEASRLLAGLTYDDLFGLDITVKRRI